MSLHHVANVSQPALHTFLTHAGILISTGEVSNLLVAGQERFHQEKQEIGLAGLASSPWQQTDDTATRVNGVNQHAHVLCNPLYTTYTTLPHKDRLWVLSVLCNQEPLGFVLTPHLPLHRQILEAFEKNYWDYYDRLLAYREHPTPEARSALSEEFDTLFVPNTGSAHLDYRIQQTAANKDKLLAVLSHPEIPLHNNASELAARRRVRKRDVSFGPRSPAGVAAWDTFQTLAATAQKLGVSFIAYLTDRVSGRNAMPSLASLITERAKEMNLGASWE